MHGQINNSRFHTDGLVYSPGPLEAAASELAGVVDGWKHPLSLPHYDGGYDAGEACAGHLQLQGR